MDTSLRKRFTSPFSLSRTTERSKLNSTSSSWQQEQFSMPPPRLPAGIQMSKSDSIMSSGRSQEKGFKSLNQNSESMTERGPRQKVCRSLFSIKPRSSEQQSHLEQTHLKQQNHPEKEQIYKKDSMFISGLLGSDKTETLVSHMELSLPEVLPEASNMDTANVHMPLEELLGTGTYNEVKVRHPFDFCELLKPEAVEKFKLVISPTKVGGPPHFPSILCSSTKSIIDGLDFEGSDIQAKRLLVVKEKLAQVPSSGQSKSTDKKRMVDMPKRKEHPVQAPSLGESISIFSDLSSTGKKRMIKGFSSVPRWGRLNNQSYQEQAKEFQEILSSKVRQIAEVADCLQHKELLYKILQF